MTSAASPEPVEPKPAASLGVEAEIVLPPHLAKGTYANGMRVFVAEHEVTLDFFIGFPAPTLEGMGAGAEVVARVNIPRELLPRVVAALQGAAESISS